VFFNPDYLSKLFRDLPLIARSGTSHVTISLIGRALYTWSKRPCGRSWELLSFEYVKISVDNKTSFEKLIYSACISRLTIGKIIWLQHLNFCNFTLWMPPCLGCPGPAPRSLPLCTPLLGVEVWNASLMHIQELLLACLCTSLGKVLLHLPPQCKRTGMFLIGKLLVCLWYHN